MSEEKKYINNEEICEEIKNLTEEELAQVSGGADKKNYYTSLNLHSEIERASQRG